MVSKSLLLWSHLPKDEEAFLAKAKEGDRTIENAERLHMGESEKEIFIQYCTFQHCKSFKS